MGSSHAIRSHLQLVGDIDKTEEKTATSLLLDPKNKFKPGAGYILGFIGEDDETYVITHRRAPAQHASETIGLAFVDHARSYALFDCNPVLELVDLENLAHIEALLQLKLRLDVQYDLETQEKVLANLAKIYLALITAYPDLQPEEYLGKEVKVSNAKIVVDKKLMARFKKTNITQFMLHGKEAVDSPIFMQRIIDETRFLGVRVFDRGQADKNLRDTAARELKNKLSEHPFAIDPDSLIMVNDNHKERIADQCYYHIEHFSIDANKKYKLSEVNKLLAVQNHAYQLLCRVRLPLVKFLEAQQGSFEEALSTLEDELSFAIAAIAAEQNPVFARKPQILKLLNKIFDCLKLDIPLINKLMLIEFFYLYGFEQYVHASSLQLIKLDELFKIAHSDLKADTELEREIVHLKADIDQLKKQADEKDNVKINKISHAIEKLQLKRHYGIELLRFERNLLLRDEELIKAYQAKQVKALNNQLSEMNADIEMSCADMPKHRKIVRP